MSEANDTMPDNNGDDYGNADDADSAADDVSDLPASLIVTNIDARVFTDAMLSRNFEAVFRSFETSPTFQYFKSFRRVRVNYESPMSAARARIQCHQTKIGDESINCYFAGPTLSSNRVESDDVHLHPPKPQKQFLISPPASPPVGWEPVNEGQPLINHELLSALANLTPGGVHELHAQTESQPAIVVHICEESDPEESLSENGRKPKIKITQTARPFKAQ